MSSMRLINQLVDGSCLRPLTSEGVNGKGKGSGRRGEGGSLVESGNTEV